MFFIFYFFYGQGKVLLFSFSQNFNNLSNLKWVKNFKGKVAWLKVSLIKWNNKNIYWIWGRKSTKKRFCPLINLLYIFVLHGKG
jgi:hypothetical protein